jgi:hypothetical protein
MAACARKIAVRAAIPLFSSSQLLRMSKSESPSADLAPYLPDTTLFNRVAQTATTVIGTVASEIAGERVLQPNSPASMVTSALGSANKSKQLARRIYFSFCPSYRTGLLLEDISRCFPNRDTANKVGFALGAT